MKNKIIIGILIIVSIGLVYYKLTIGDFNSQLLAKMSNINDISTILSSEDLQVLKEEKKYIDFLDKDIKDFISNYNKNDKLTFNEKNLNSTLKQIKIINNTKKNELTLTLTNENKEWKLVLNFLKNREILNTKKEINNYASQGLSSDYEFLIEKYELLEELEKQSYSYEIKKLKEKLDEINNYNQNLKLIKVEITKVTKGLIYFNIINNSDEFLNKISGKISIVDKNGNILFNKELNLYEKKEGDFLMGQLINPNYSKPIIFKIDLPNIDKDKYINIEVLSYNK